MAPGSVSSASGKPLKPVRVAVITTIVLAVLGLAFWRANASYHAARPKRSPAQTIQRSFTLGSLANERGTFLLEQPGSREILKFATPRKLAYPGRQTTSQIPDSQERNGRIHLCRCSPE